MALLRLAPKPKMKEVHMPLELSLGAKRGVSSRVRASALPHYAPKADSVCVYAKKQG